MKIGKVTPQLNTNFQYDTWVKEDEVKLAMPTETPTGPYADFGSANFNGTSAYLAVPDHADWDIGTGDATRECWVQFTTDQYCSIFEHNPDNTDSEYCVYEDTGNTIEWTIELSAVNRLKVRGVPFTPVIGDWYHIACVRDGTEAYIYINGVRGTPSSYTAPGSYDLSGITGPFYVGARAWNSSQFFAGNISEFRLSKGIARYTSNFTPSTTPHTSDANTKLLLHFDGDYTDSGNTGHTITPDNTVLNWTETKLLMHGNKVADASGTAKQITAVGTASPFSFKFGSYAGGFFGNSGSYISAPDHADWDMGSGDFTYDYWIRVNDNGNYMYTAGTGTGTYTTSGVQLGVHIDGYAFAAIFVGNDHRTVQFGVRPVNDGEWHHIAFVRYNDVLRLYTDGYEDGTPVDVTGESMNTTTGGFFVGKPGIWNNFYYAGSVDEFRVSKGIARWTENFTPPTAPHTSDSYTKLLLHLDNNVTDSGDTTHTITNTGMVFAQSSVGTGSYYFDGNSDYFTVPDSTDWNLFTTAGEDWTIDGWINFSTLQSSVIVGQYDTSTFNSWKINYSTPADTLTLGVYVGGYQINFSTGALGFSTDTWYHMALCRVGDEYAFYIDGAQDGYTQDTSTVVDMASTLNVGRHGDGTLYFAGYQEDLRIVKGNPFGAAPNVGETDTITVPTSSHTGDDPRTNVSFAVSGDDNEMYKVVAYFNNGYGGSTNYKLLMNSSETGNYAQRLYAVTSTEYAGRTTDVTSTYLGRVTATEEKSFGTALIHAKSGGIRLYDIQAVHRMSGSTVYALHKYSVGWSNTTDNVKTIDIEADQTIGIGTGSQITLYKKVTR